ncbi:hypothetical protein FLJC2902T_32550 [Flavobacterium limnosediminis JC2902]|uniref:Uncharacterized protein n=2 Tax=Flavobacterium TaxID=237 RepID=V6S968_9FLAO|nr:hypothetical protein FLJC2902T_32550 [Flavobacterium limnosediminis JC2902]
MRNKIIYAILFISFIITFFILFLTTDFYIPERKPLECKKALGNEIVKQVNIREMGNDTIFLGKRRYNIIESEYTGKPSVFNEFKTKISRLKLAINEPYVIDFRQTYDNMFNFENRTIIVGDITSDFGVDNPINFTSEIINFEIKPEDNKRKIYEIKYENIEEDEITISLYDEIRKEEKYNFTFELNGENCKLKS